MALDFFEVRVKEGRKEDSPLEVYADFVVGWSQDLMVRGGAFYAVWNPRKELWSTREYDVAELVDEAIMDKVRELEAKGLVCTPKLLRSNSNNAWNSYKKYIKNASDNSVQLDVNLTFLNTPVKQKDYVSRRLPYALAPGDYSAWDEIVGTLYIPEEREKIEWAIGAIVSGDSKKIEKFLVFYGPGGTGKSTIMKIIQKLFPGYIATFEAKALVGSNNSFATEAFKSNPLVAIQHDGDLSRIDDNSTLNSVVGHDTMRINEKYKAGYDAELNAFLFMGTNRPVKITDAQSGLIRRLIDVAPSLKTIENGRYHALMHQVEFQLGAIAQHCLEVYNKVGGKNRYGGYVPERMMLQTNPFFNFIEEHYEIFERQGGTTTWKQAWELYKEWSEFSKIGFMLKRYQFREELKNYFDEFHDRIMVDGKHERSFYKGFNAQKFKRPIPKADETDKEEEREFSLVLEHEVSILDEMYAGLPAQYANAGGTPKLYWDDSERINKETGEPFIPTEDQIVSTVLGELDTKKLHFLKVPLTHIAVDFDCKGEDGKKSLEASLKAASQFPPTYAEVSKSGKGVHLHYIYDGDVTQLANNYGPGIEIKVFSGNTSLRRKLTKCNDVAVATISSGLPFKEKKVLPTTTMKTEKGLRNMIERNMRKEFHPGTKPSIDFIEFLLNEAYDSGLIYDLSDMRPRVLAFANNSTNQASECMKALMRMKFQSEMTAEEAGVPEPVSKDDRIVFFDCEVYPNLFVICWKFQGADDSTMSVMINPSAREVEQLFQFKLVGFNNRSYDNHILWAAFLGYDNQQLYELSQKIIVHKDMNAKFGEAYGLSYADVWDFAVNKQGLKKWEIELGLPHMEMSIPWDKPVPKELWDDVVKYCCNDVSALEFVFNHNKNNFVARQILSDLSGLPVNSPTRMHAIRIIFGNDRTPQDKFVYTDLSDEFPGYRFDPYAPAGEKSTYRGEFVGEGGYVYAEPGIHENVALLDVASMHPSTIIHLNLFGPYTKNFVKLVEARLAIKHASECWGKGDEAGALEYLEEANRLMPGVEVTKENAKPLADALKLVINSVYGYTSAKFDNPFRDKRNIDNIVAKRGALFMIDLKHALQEQGYTVAHIKTDSVKIPEADRDVIEFVYEFGAKYGYTFEHEATYDIMCLANDAVYIAKQTESDPPGGYEEHWNATGAQFQHPYVFKSLFSHEGLEFKDLCETKRVTEGAIYLAEEGVDDIEKMHHVGGTGLFVPVYKEAGGKKLWRVKDGKKYAVAGTKDHYWVEAEEILARRGDQVERMVWENLEDAVAGTGSLADVVDGSYFVRLAEEAIDTIEKFGMKFSDFVS